MCPVGGDSVQIFIILTVHVFWFTGLWHDVLLPYYCNSVATQSILDS